MRDSCVMNPSMITKPQKSKNKPIMEKTISYEFLPTPVLRTKFKELFGGGAWAFEHGYKFPKIVKSGIAYFVTMIDENKIYCQKGSKHGEEVIIDANTLRRTQLIYLIKEMKKYISQRLEK